MAPQVTPNGIPFIDKPARAVVTVPREGLARGLALRRGTLAFFFPLRATFTRTTGGFFFGILRFLLLLNDNNLGNPGGAAAALAGCERRVVPPVLTDRGSNGPDADR